MKHIFVLLMALLLLGACKSSNTLEASVLEDGTVQEPTKTTQTAQKREDAEEEGPALFEDVTDIKTYELKGQCTKDSKGVVRLFDESGKKTVYRNECSFNFLVQYDCEEGGVTSQTITCDRGCVTDPYGDRCK